MLYAVTAEEMRELDRKTIEEIGLPGAVLMETAGRRLAGAVLSLEGDEPTEPVAVVCGGGNNGGDGFVCARVLREHGIGALVYLTVAEDALRGDAAVHFGAYRESGGVVIGVQTTEQLEAAAESITDSAVVVDCIFGTGLAREVEGHLADVIDVINACDGVVVACDVPSGLDANTGQPLGVAVVADLTVTMAFAKVGLIGAPGLQYVGELQVVEIGIPTDLGSRSTVAYLETDDAIDMIPWPRPFDHKNRRGHVLVLGGSPGQRGAARLASEAALRAGAGLVTWASPSDRELTAADPIMSVAIDTTAPIKTWLPTLLVGVDAIVCGPGMAKDEWGRELVFAILADASVPLVLDADALGHIAATPDGLSAVADYDSEVVMTPHPGEAARLLDISTADVQADRFGAARRLAESAITVLKGARTVVTDDELATVNGTGNPGMATAGSGDVLAGVIAALLAQDLDGSDAARLGVFVHGLAGDIAATDLGPHSVTATDIVAALGAAFVELADADSDDER